LARGGGVITGGKQGLRGRPKGIKKDSGQVDFVLPIYFLDLKGLSYEIDFKNVAKNLQILASIRAAAG
jgi:hypothetical protein